VIRNSNAGGASREKNQKIAQQHSSQIEKASRENSKSNSTHLRKENSFFSNQANNNQTNQNNPNTSTTTKIISNANLDTTNLISNSIYGNASNISLISNPHNPSSQQFKTSSRAVLSSKQLNNQIPSANTKVDCLTSSGKAN